MTKQGQFLQKLGARILSEANDLKRTPSALAQDIGIPLEIIESTIAGQTDLTTAENVMKTMAEVYPISLADIWLDSDDTDNGVLVMTAEQSRRSSRIFDRVDRTGSTSPYYEYRDTAMSQLAPFKPEWIAEIRYVDNADPENPDVAYNKGHFMHQTTFFIGPVNFYWEIDGRRYCEEMNTGDSNYITPFVPHSFTSRDSETRGLIIAITYGGEVRRAYREFASVDGQSLMDHAGNLDVDAPFALRMKRQLAAESMTVPSFVSRMIENGCEAPRAQALLDGEVPTWDEVQSVAQLLNVRPADLMADSVPSERRVVVRKLSTTPGRGYPDGNQPAYQLVELARCSHQPLLKGFDVAVLGGPGGDMYHALHEYIYNYGDAPVDLVWADDQRRTLQPGDSAYVLPLVTHRFERVTGAEDGKLAMIRVPGAFTDSVLDEFASFAPSGKKRAIEETSQWF